MLHTLLADTATAHDAGGLLCTLLLIVAVIATALCILALLGVGVGPFGRRPAAGGYGYLGGPVVAAVIAWVLYVLLC